jgi:hypothetical protein
MNIFRTLLFFPSITFSLLASEIFPWAFLYSLIEKFRSYRKIDKKILLLAGGFLISLSYSLYLIVSNGYDSDFTRSIVAYLNPVLAYSAILYCSRKELSALCSIIGKVLCFLTVVGILQTLGAISFLEPVFKFMVPRSLTESFELGGRGVTLLSSEPARASYEILFIYITWRYLQKMTAVNKLCFDLCIVVFILFILKSSMGAITLIVFLLCEYRMKFILAGLTVAAVGGPFLIGADSRAISVMTEIFSSSSSGEIFEYVLSASGFRLISLIAAYMYGIFHPLGGGIGLWQTTSVEALYETGINPLSMYYFNSFGGFVPVRPTSFLSSIVLDMGWLAIAVIFYLIKPLFKLVSFDNELFSLVITFLFYVAAVGAIGNPIPWICAAVCYRVYKERLLLPETA